MLWFQLQNRVELMFLTDGFLESNVNGALETIEVILYKLL